MSIEATKTPVKRLSIVDLVLSAISEPFLVGCLKENRLRPEISSFAGLPARNQCRFDAGDHSRTGVEGIYRMAGKHGWS